MKTLRRIIAGLALTAAVAAPLLTPAPAEAWWRGGWHGGWGWHAGWGWHPGWGWRGGWGWGWRGGVVVGAPGVVVGAPVYAAPGYYYHWVPGYWAGRVWVRPHWGYR
jgi:hypothetical protein